MRIPPMRIDSHQHFWSYSAREYPWISDGMQRLRQDFLPADLEREWTQVPLAGSVAVQARQSLEESRWLLQLAENHQRILGVVGWVNLQSEAVDQELAELSRHRAFVGVRHVVQDEPDDAFLLRPEFLRGLARLREFRLAYDLLLFPKHLRPALQVVRQFPDQRFVLDHISKPAIKTGELSPWQEDIRELARCPNVWCKISGMVTEARWGGWKRNDFRPYLDVVCEAFGEDRLMFGSDWPVCLVSGSYPEVFGIVEDYLQSWSPLAQEKILGRNAATFYNLPTPPSDTHPTH